MNPVRGGRPPRERRMRGVRVVRAGVFAQEVASALILVELLILRTKKAEAVIMKYVIKVRRVSWGENWRTRIIQPRWAMEEYARILRSCVWFSPPQPPTRVEVSPRRTSKFELVG